MVQGWGRFTPDDFVFAAKVPQTVTHDRFLDVARGADKDVLVYCELMRPLLDAGKLGPLLLQLPPRLRFEESTIHRFLDALPHDFTFALEPRNKSWMALEAFDLLRSTGVAYTIVDEPLLPPDLHVTSRLAYVRWHGHGTSTWYDYRYSEGDTGYGFFNHHFHGYAPENCVQILRMLGVQTQEQARALQRIDGFRKQATGAAVRTRALTLEDFGADVPKDALVDAALGKFMDTGRLDRAKRIDSRDVEITRDGDVILARVGDYRVEIDPEAKTITHGCDDWKKRMDRQDFCKHVAKLFLSLPKADALSRLEAIAAARDAWTFQGPSA